MIIFIFGSFKYHILIWGPKKIFVALCFVFLTINSRNIEKIKAELQVDCFCPVSQFSTEKCPNRAFGEFCNNMRHKSKLRLVFYSFIVFLS